jgi:hypothetical protein
MDIYYKKYLKYKEKYLKLKGGNKNENMDFFFNFNKIKDQIIEKYNNFNDINNINIPIHRIGTPSANGFINDINFKNNIDDKNFNTILKTSRLKEADNNYYEYVVGRCINKIKEYYPNFVYTFNYFNMTEELKYELSSNVIYFDKMKIVNDLKPLGEKNEHKLQLLSKIENGCINNDKSAILIENIPDSISLDKLVEEPEFIADKEINVFNILFQIYFVLSSLSDIYTHYDLHAGNVMILKLSKKVQINYVSDKIYKIYTKYIPIIIDYGRNHVNCLKFDSTILSSIYSEIACDSQCNIEVYPKCLTNLSGLVFKSDSKLSHNDMNSFDFINPRIKNKSHDLRFIIYFMNYFKGTLINNPSDTRTELELKDNFYGVFNEINSPEWYTLKGYKYGVRESVDTLHMNKLSTIHDVLGWLIKYYNKNNLELKNEVDIYGLMIINYDINKKIKWTYKSKKELEIENEIIALATDKQRVAKKIPNKINPKSNKID